jgi:hypothetical protein
MAALVLPHVDELIDRSRSSVLAGDASEAELGVASDSTRSVAEDDDGELCECSVDARTRSLSGKLKLRHDVELHRIATTTGKVRQAALIELLIQATAHVPRVLVDGSTHTMAPDRRYFELIADAYACGATSIDGLEPTLFALWSNDAFAPLFAATMYKWLFLQSAAQLNRNFIIFLKGANRLFWSDLHGDTMHFAPLFHFVRDRVLMRPFRSSCRTASFAYFFADLFNLVARFHFFYLPNEDPRNLIAAMSAAMPTMPPLVTPSGSLAQVLRSASNDMLSSLFKAGDAAEAKATNGAASVAADAAAASPGAAASDDDQRSAVDDEATPTESPPQRQWIANAERRSTAPPLLVGAEFDAEYDPMRVAVLLDAAMLSDMFVQSVVKALLAIRSEGALVAYLICCRTLREFDMTSATSLRLESAVYNYTIPGSPLYPPRSVRNAAQQTAPLLYPRGIVARAVIYVFFRMLHPVYTTRSIVFWLHEEWRQMRQLGPLQYVSDFIRVRAGPKWRAWRKRN